MSPDDTKTRGDDARKAKAGGLTTVARGFGRAVGFVRRLVPGGEPKPAPRKKIARVVAVPFQRIAAGSQVPREKVAAVMLAGVVGVMLARLLISRMVRSGDAQPEATGKDSDD